MVPLAPGFGHSQLSGVLHGAIQRTISDQLAMTKPELAGIGDGLGSGASSSVNTMHRSSPLPSG
eukprot:7740709-Alexandrium_andersonii.AAC.1